MVNPILTSWVLVALAPTPTPGNLWERLRRKILAVTKMFSISIFVRHHQNDLDCVGLAHEPRAISPQYSSISRFGTPGPKLQTVTLRLKTHSSISVSVGMCVDPPDCGGPLTSVSTKSKPRSHNDLTMLWLPEVRKNTPFLSLFLLNVLFV